MKSRLLWLVTWSAIVASTAFAAPRKSSGSSDPVHVKGYIRKDGTYVAPHDRSAPNSTKNDNWSTKGNVNPETGKVGTKPGDAGSSSSSTAAGSTSAAVSPPAKAATPAPASAASAPTSPASTVDLKKVRLGMNKTQVIAETGEPNIKTENSWFYLDGGWVKFKAGTVVTGIEAR